MTDRAYLSPLVIPGNQALRHASTGYQVNDEYY